MVSGDITDLRYTLQGIHSDLSSAVSHTAEALSDIEGVLAGLPDKDTSDIALSLSAEDWHIVLRTLSESICVIDKLGSGVYDLQGVSLVTLDFILKTLHEQLVEAT